MEKLYAVRKGKVPGVYTTWAECQEQIKGFKSNEFKKFEGETYLDCFIKCNEYLDSGDELKEGVQEVIHQASLSIKELEAIYTEPDTAIAFTDGSFNSTDKIYGCGVVIITNGEAIETYSSGNDESVLSMNNVAGEILGAMTAMKYCHEHKIKELILCYDYNGIENWCTGSFKATKEGTMAYRDYYNSIKDELKVTFVHTKGHTGIELNEHVDKLAKKSVGIED